MAKPVKALAAALLLLALLGGAGWFLLKDPAPAEKPATEELSVVSRTPEEVRQIEVSNRHGSYTVLQKEGGWQVGDLPSEHVNGEYVQMLLDECSDIRYLSVACEDVERREEFGLSEPEAWVAITYTDGSREELLIGAKEPVSGGRYFMERDGSEILMMKEGRSIRFTMELERYLDIVIIPPEQTASVLGELQDMRFSGSSIPEPIELKAVLPEREELQTIGISFGSVTHLLMGDGIYEANSTKLLEIGDGLLGLLSEEIIDYNCSQEELAAYGFDEPYLEIEFDYKNGKEAEVIPYRLRVSTLGEEYIATVNDEGIVYRILDLPFLHVRYEDLVLRWFVSPFISEVAALSVTIGGQESRYVLTGETVKDIAVTLNEQSVAEDLFRSYYNLVTSAAFDGEMLAQEPALSGEPLAVIRYEYKKEGKKDDVIRIYPGELRHVYVEVNDSCRFVMRENFLTVLAAAGEALLRGESFATDW